MACTATRVSTFAKASTRGRGATLRRQVSTAAPVTTKAALLGDDLAILSAAVEKAELTGALTGDKPLTVFAPTDAAFAQVCEDLQLSKEEVLGLESLADILTYHVVDGTVTSADLKDGEVPTLNERFSLDVAGTTVNGANIVKADDTIGNLTVHRVDAVMFPPWSAPAKVLTPQQVLAFEGWAPEVINGRLAMLGFLTAVVQEVATGQSFTEQFSSNFGIFAAQIQLWAFASLAPAFSSNEGYTADPFSMDGFPDVERGVQGRAVGTRGEEDLQRADGADQRAGGDGGDRRAHRGGDLHGSRPLLIEVARWMKIVWREVLGLGCSYPKPVERVCDGLAAAQF
jgi:uncharacterized surface protein with fasciclin (FAS1) repeats